jgi:methyltransferase family protein
MSLWGDFLHHDGRPIHKWTHYFPVYERHLERFRNRSVTMVEIGVGQGGSLQMWKRYLGPLAQIIGLDTNPACSAFEESQIAVRIGDQSDLEFLGRVVEEFRPIDVILDDGSHRMDHLTASFKFLFPQLDRNGVYLVEDLHTAYWDEFGGGYKREGSFIEMVKVLIDELNADYTRGAVAPTPFTATTTSLHIYDSLVVFERGRHVKKEAIEIGDEV